MSKLVAVIEIPKGSQYKYEIKDKVLLLDRINTMAIPENYGAILETLALDSDPLDIFLRGLENESLFPGCHVEVKPFAMIKTFDKGVSDNKLVASLFNLSKKNKHTLIDDIANYLHTYKKTSDVRSIVTDMKVINKEIKMCQDRFNIQSLKDYHERMCEDSKYFLLDNISNRTRHLEGDEF